MHDPGGGQSRQGLAEFRHQPPHTGRLQQAALADRLGEAEAGQVLGGHPQQCLVEAGAEEMRRARGTDPPVHGGLPLEPPTEVRALGVLGPDHLHGGEPRGVVRAPGQIDPAHAAAAEQPERDVGPDTRGVGGQQRDRARLPQRGATGRRYVCHGPLTCLFVPQRALVSHQLTEERLAPRRRGVPGYRGSRAGGYGSAVSGPPPRGPETARSRTGSGRTPVTPVVVRRRGGVPPSSGTGPRGGT